MIFEIWCIYRSVMMKFRDIRFAITDRITIMLIGMIKIINPYKNNSLSYELHTVADMYDTRPEGCWGYQQPPEEEWTK